MNPGVNIYDEARVRLSPLWKAKTLPVGDNTIDISFRCTVRNVAFGMGYQFCGRHGRLYS